MRSNSVPVAHDPGTVLRHALQLRDQLRYDDVVALCDQASLEAWFNAFRQGTRLPARDDLRRQLPHLSDDQIGLALAALEAQQASIGKVPGTAHYAEVHSMTPAEFARRWLEHDDPRCDINRRLLERGRPVAAWGIGRYATGLPEPIGDGVVRVPYWSDDSVPPTDKDEAEYEELKLGTDGQWRLIGRLGLLQPRGSSSFFIPEEFTYLYA